MVVAPVIVPADRKNPLTVLVLPVIVKVFAAIFNRAPASTVKLFATVIAAAAVTSALVFEINKNANPVAVALIVWPALPSK